MSHREVCKIRSYECPDCLDEAVTEGSEPRFMMTRSLLLDYQRVAEKRAEERIIKLLETKHRCPLKGQWHDLGQCPCKVTALIKGEQK